MFPLFWNMILISLFLAPVLSIPRRFEDTCQTPLMLEAPASRGQPDVSARSIAPIFFQSSNNIFLQYYITNHFLLLTFLWVCLSPHCTLVFCVKRISPFVFVGFSLMPYVEVLLWKCYILALVGLDFTLSC